MKNTTASERDFSVGKMWTNITSQAVPLTIAQLVQLLYNIIDRIYIGHLPGVGSLALTVFLPMFMGLGTNGVFLAEPISNLIGGLACFITMYVTVYRRL